MKSIVAISLGASRRSRDEVLRIQGQEFRLTQVGADFNRSVFLRLIAQAEGRCDAIALAYLPQPINFGRHLLRNQIFDEIEALGIETPICFGFTLRSEVTNWNMQHAISHGQIELAQAKTVMMSGLAQYDLLKHLDGRVASLTCLDPWIVQRLPMALRSAKALERYGIAVRSVLMRYIAKKPQRTSLNEVIGGRFVSSALKGADLVASPASFLDSLEPALLRGKVLLLDYLPDGLAQRLRAANVANCFAFRNPLGDDYKYLSFSVAEAVIGLLRDAPGDLSTEDILEYLTQNEVSPELYQLRPGNRASPRKFGFVIHPLHRGDLYRHPLLKGVGYLPKGLTQSFEKAVAHVPGVAYGQISGIRSEHNGVHADGKIYTLFATPKEMLRAKPQDIYDKLIHLAEVAKADGAEIFGLGAFTKIVGDAGVTVAGRSPIPVTTGNSLSAAATLWAAREASRRLGLLQEPSSPGERVRGRCMILGATGSIGKACAKVLANLFDEVVLAATNGARLLTLQEEMVELAPGTKIRVTTQPDRFSSSCDVIIISTSATEGGVLSIAKIKPGCVVCDVSRPLTFKAAEAITRPDILIIESGEIELPGDVRISCDIGLPRPIVYACLAETALLALEGRLEPFTLSRNINYKKVKEIYKIARKHGARLSAIRSPTGLVTEQELALCREHALQALKTWGQP